LPLADSLGELEAAEGYLAALLAGSATTASLVVGRHGETVGLDGTSKSLGGPADLEWLRFLRANAEVVLTSGKNFRDESYRMPRSADLAVLSRKVGEDALRAELPQRFLVLRSGGYFEALTELHQRGYKRVHIEFGPSGLLELVKVGVPLWISSQYPEGIGKLAESMNLHVEPLVKFEDLHIALGRSAAWQ
jgi:hypothetical protein